MTSDQVKYFGYALQVILILVLVVSLAYKSWALLGVCLGAAVVLLVLVCIQLLGQPKAGAGNFGGFRENVSLMKRHFTNMTDQTNQTNQTYSVYPSGPQVSYQGNLLYAYPQPMPLGQHLDMAPLPQGQALDMPAHGHMAIPYEVQADELTIDEKVAMYHMTHVERGPSMQAPVSRFTHPDFVPQSQGADAFSESSYYASPVAGSAPPPLPAHLDSWNPDNPMTSLSYLYKY